jgi:hypothetical protein
MRCRVIGNDWPGLGHDIGLDWTIPGARLGRINPVISIIFEKTHRRFLIVGEAPDSVRVGSGGREQSHLSALGSRVS